jgi:hypothetical protein
MISSEHDIDALRRELRSLEALPELSCPTGCAGCGYEMERIAEIRQLLKDARKCHSRKKRPGLLDPGV